MMRYLHQSDDISSPACLLTIYVSEFILPSGLTANSRYKKRRKVLLAAAKKERETNFLITRSILSSELLYFVERHIRLLRLIKLQLFQKKHKKHMVAKEERNKFLNHTINFVVRATVPRGTTY